MHQQTITATGKQKDNNEVMKNTSQINLFSFYGFYVANSNSLYNMRSCPLTRHSKLKQTAATLNQRNVQTVAYNLRCLRSADKNDLKQKSRVIALAVNRKMIEYTYRI